MLNCQSTKEVLERIISDIDFYLTGEASLYEKIKKVYDENWSSYQYMECFSLYGEKFIIKENNFEEVYAYNVEFLEKQVNFMKKLLKLEYFQKEYKLSKYTENVFEKCITTIKNEYEDILCHPNQFMICNKTNISETYNCLLLLEKFFSIENNIVLIGGNGTGKSSLANVLKSDDTEYIAVIPAQKNLYFSLSDTRLLTTEKDELIRMLFENNISKGKSNDIYASGYYEFQNNQFTKLVLGMISEYTRYLYECADKAILPNQNDTVFGKLQKVFNIMFPNIKLECSVDQAFSLKCHKDGNSYSINGLSEGEKVVIYYTISVLLAKADSFIIVDEPETYINPSLTNCLWDTLTDLRADCQFIFITHSVDFVLGRSNAKIAWIKSYKYPHEWEFELLDSDKDIPKTMLTEILGSQKSIVFCEGTEKSSLDYHIYKAILEKDFTIIPVDGHRKVVECCRAVNKLNINYKVYGIIDGDNHSERQKLSYIRDNIFVLPFNEIEMFLINDVILNEVMSTLYPTDYVKRIENFKDRFWKKIEDRIEKIVLDSIKQVVNEHIETQKIEKGNTLQNIKEGIKKIEFIDIDSIYSDKKAEIEKIISDKDYNAALVVCTLKTEITKDIARGCLDNDYQEKVKQQIMANSELQRLLKEHYFKFLY